MGSWRYRKGSKHWHKTNLKDENKNIVQSQGKYFANQTDQTQEWI